MQTMMVRVVKGPPGSKVIGWVCEVLPSDELIKFMDALGHEDNIKLRTCDETIHPEGYFYAYKRNTEPV